MNLEGQVVAITGSGGELAQDYIGAVSKLGATAIYLPNTNEDYRHFDRLVAAGALVLELADDLSVATAVTTTVSQVLEEHGRIDVLYNAADPYAAFAAAGESEADISEIMESRFCSTYRLVQAVLPSMREQGYGRVINTTSGIGMFGSPERSVFSAISAAMIGFTKSVALEHKDLGIHVNAIAPYALDFGGEVSVLPRSESEMAATVLAYLSHRDCKLTGEVISVGQGRISRYFTNTGPGYLEYGAQIDDIGDNLDVILSTQSAVTPLRAEDELLLVEV